MLNLKFIFIFVILPFNLKFSKAMHDTTVELVQIVMRNGHRTPISLYPNEVYNETFWSQYGGLGVVTSVGLSQLYDFGQFLKSNYTKYLTQPYDESRVFARSTDYSRTLTSGYAFLSGLYQPSSNQVWNAQLQNWYPIPVYTTDRNSDPIFYNTANCQRYKFLQAESRITVDYYKLQNDNKDFISTIANYSGVRDLGLYTLSKIVDNYIVEKGLNLALPNWLTDNNDKLLTLNNYYIYFDLYTLEMAKLVSGGLLNDMVNKINQKTQTQSKLQLNAYFAHDIHIAALHKLLGLSNPIVQPQFASALIFELRKKINTTNYYVRVLYKNNPDNQPIELKALTIGGCTELCSLSDFLQKTSDYLVTNFTDACSATSSMYPILPIEKVNTDLEVALIITTSVLSTVVVILFVLLVCRLCVCKQGFRKYILQK